MFFFLKKEYCEPKGNATQQNNGDIEVIILLRTKTVIQQLSSRCQCLTTKTMFARSQPQHCFKECQKNISLIHFYIV